MKKVCWNCRSLFDHVLRPTCGLGYQIVAVPKRIEGATLIIPTPGEECPKPLTWDAWMNADPKKKAT